MNERRSRGFPMEIPGAASWSPLDEQLLPDSFNPPILVPGTTFNHPNCFDDFNSEHVPSFPSNAEDLDVQTEKRF